MEKLPYYKRLVLTREFLLHSEMLPVDPTCIDRTLDQAVDRSEGCWNEYYAIYRVGEFGDIELVDEGLNYQTMAEAYKYMLYDEYVDDFDPAEGEPVSLAEWESEDLPQILDELFPSRVDDKGKE